MKIKIETYPRDGDNGHDHYYCTDHIAVSRTENLAETPEHATTIHGINGQQIINPLNQTENCNQREKPQE